VGQKEKGKASAQAKIRWTSRVLKTRKKGQKPPRDPEKVKQSRSTSYHKGGPPAKQPADGGTTFSPTRGGEVNRGRGPPGVTGARNKTRVGEGEGTAKNRGGHEKRWNQGLSRRCEKQRVKKGNGSGAPKAKREEKQQSLKGGPGKGGGEPNPGGGEPSSEGA